MFLVPSDAFPGEKSFSARTSSPKLRRHFDKRRLARHRSARPSRARRLARSRRRRPGARAPSRRVARRRRRRTRGGGARPPRRGERSGGDARRPRRRLARRCAWTTVRRKEEPGSRGASRGATGRAPRAREPRPLAPAPRKTRARRKTPPSPSWPVRPSRVASGRRAREECVDASNADPWLSRFVAQKRFCGCRAFQVERRFPSLVRQRAAARLFRIDASRALFRR